MPDNKRFANLPQFRRMSQMAGSKRNKGGSTSFRDFWNPPIAPAEPEQVILFPGNYPVTVELEDGSMGTQEFPMLPFYQHYIPQGASGRYATCSAGLRLLSDGDNGFVYTPGTKPCAYCEDDRINRPTFNYVYNVIVLGDWHCIEYEENGWPRSRWEPCLGKRCSWCQRREPVITHRRAFWKIPEFAADTLKGYELGKFQSYCRECFEIMKDAGATCPSCNFILQSLELDPLSPAEFRSYLSTPVRCEKCGHYDYPEPQRICPKCENNTALEIWDVVLELHRREQGKAGRKGKKTQLEVFGWRPLDKELRQQLKELEEPFDFQNMSYFTAQSRSDQMELLDRESSSRERDEGNYRNRGQHQVDYGDRDNDRYPPRGPREAQSFDRPSFLDRTRREEEDDSPRNRSWSRR